jgi:hypothetical protein
MMASTDPTGDSSLRSTPRVALLGVPRDRHPEYSEQLRAAGCILVGPDEALCWITFSSCPANEDPGMLPVIVVVERLGDVAPGTGTALGLADGMLTLPLRPQDIEVQISFACQNRRMRQVQAEKMERLVSSLRQRRHVERAIERIAAREKLDRLQAFEVLRRTAMNRRMPIWVLAEEMLDGGGDRG